MRQFQTFGHYLEAGIPRRRAGPVERQPHCLLFANLRIIHPAVCS
jgi:hypothetical protein